MRFLSGLVVVAGIGLSGCFKAEVANCTVSCASSADCPGGLACDNGFCAAAAGACSGNPDARPDADLTRPQNLIVTTEGDGTVTSDPAGISCGATCDAEFDPLTTVTLTATPGGNAVFDGWTGDCTGASSTCSLVMDNTKAATAKFALHGALRWVHQISFTGMDFFDGELDIDPAGNVVAAGQIDEAGALGLYVVKRAKDTGAQLWQQTFNFGTSGAVTVGGIDTDSDGNVYVCGRAQGGTTPLMFGTMSVTGDIFGDIVVVKLAAADGSVLWVKDCGGGAEEICGGIAVVGTEFYVAGTASSMPAVFDSVSLTGTTDDAFVIRAATSNGTAQQGVIIDGSFDITDVAAVTGAVAITGNIRSAATIGSCSLSPSSTGNEGFILSFTGSLVCAWDRNFGSNVAGVPTFANAIAAVPGGGWVVTGGFQGSVLFADSGTLPTANGTDAYIARYDANGGHVYSFTYGGAGVDEGLGIDVLPSGEVVFGGTFASAISFGSTNLTGTSDLFVTRMSSGNTPVHQWAAKIGGTSALDNMRGLGLAADGTVNILNQWMGMTEVGGMAMTAQDYDAWIGSFVR